MEKDEYYILPPLIELTDFKGDFQRYLEAVYDLFKKDFIDNRPCFEGKRLGLKKYPMSEGKEATFWHMTSEGEEEAERTPDLRRLERIKWPASLINDSQHPYLKVWENTRGNKTNILIFHEKERYLVVLRKHENYLLPWTAYLVEYEPRLRKLMNEYKAYKKQNPPSKN